MALSKSNALFMKAATLLMHWKCTLIILTSMAYAASADVTSIKPDDLFSALGQNKESTAVQTLMKEIGDAPEIHHFSDSYYYNFKEKGISLKFDTSDELVAIFLYREGADEFSQYKGKLPFGIDWKMSREAIEDILGIPSFYGGEGIINLYAPYRKKGISINYNTKSLTDSAAKMAYITLVRYRQ